MIGIRSVVDEARGLAATLHSDVHRRWWSQYIPPKPRTINLLANDICNSRCQMCMIWKQKKDHELMPEELSGLLSDRLFTQIRHVGITGGEPTLRNDLPQLFEAACRTLPRITTASIITNAIRQSDVIDRINRLDRRLDNLIPDFGLGGFLRRTDRLTDQPKHIFIVGWYGTETVGDKAILGNILDVYQARYRDVGVRFSISSLYPWVTDRTLQELGRDQDATVIPVYSQQFVKTCATADEVVMGGGPLMDMQSLAIPLWALSLAKRFGHKATVYGCGMGPLNSARYINAVTRILSLADTVTLRDQASVTWAKRLTGRDDITCQGDPAADYVKAASAKLVDQPTTNVLACFLRQWPANYRGDLSHDKYLDMRTEYEANLAKLIKQVCSQHGLIPVLYPMSTCVGGLDDRDFNRQFAAQYFTGGNITVDRKPSSVTSIVQAMRAARMSLCMRSHSVLFAHTLGADYLAIDYTLGGKISGFLHDHKATDRMINLCDLADTGPANAVAVANRLLNGASPGTAKYKRVAA